MISLLNTLKKTLSNPSNKNIFTMLIGTSAAQVIPVVASLILTRIYTPEEYGLLAIFVSLVTIMGTIVTLRYELAILVPTKEQDAVNITILSIVSSLIISLLIFSILLGFKNEILDALNIKSLGNWLFLVPIATLFMGIYNSLNYLATRVGLFKVISKTRIYQALYSSIAQILLGLMHMGVGGLIIGATLSNIIGNLKIIGKLLDSTKDEIKRFRPKDAYSLAKRYSDYPKYSVPSTIFNNVSLHSMSFIIPTFFSASLLGQYSLSQRIIILPMKVISNSISQVFLNEASMELKKSNTTKNSFISTFKKLVCISLPLYTILFFVVKDLIILAFGETWEPAGEISQMLIILLFFRFIVTPLSNVLNLYEKQKIVLIWQVSLVILTIISAMISIIYALNFKTFLAIYVCTLSIDYVIMFIICLYFSGRQKHNFIEGSD